MAGADRLRVVVTSARFASVANALVVVNVVLMCVPYEGMAAGQAAAIESAVLLLTVAFVVEMGLKLFALGCAAYWADTWNRLDGTIVVLSVLELVAALLPSAASGGVQLSFLRMLRLQRVLRLLRLLRSIRGLYHLVLCFGRALLQVSPVVSMSM